MMRDTRRSLGSTHQIQSCLFVGGEKEACDPSFIEANNIHSVITLTLRKHEATVHWFPLSDDQSGCDAFLGCADSIADCINSELMKGKNVLVHCRAGKNRSTSAIIAYLIRHKKLSLAEARKKFSSYFGLDWKKQLRSNRFNLALQQYCELNQASATAC